eukprot:g34215.t1
MESRKQVEAKFYHSLLTNQIVCIRHKINSQGLSSPTEIRLQFDRTLQNLSLELSLEHTLPLTFESSSRRTVASINLADACMGFYSPHGNETRRILSDTPSRAEVDHAKTLTLFFFQLEPLYIELPSQEVAEKYLKAFQWLKIFLCGSCHNHSTPEMNSRGTLRHENLFLFPDRKSKPTAVILEWNLLFNTIDIKPTQGGEVERFPVAAIDGIHYGRHSDIFGITKWAFSLLFKENLYRSLHLAVPDHTCLKNLIQSLRSLAKVSLCDCESLRQKPVMPQLHTYEDADASPRQNVNFHFSPQLSSRASPQLRSRANEMKQNVVNFHLSPQQHYRRSGYGREGASPRYGREAPSPGRFFNSNSSPQLRNRTTVVREEVAFKHNFNFNLSPQQRKKALLRETGSFKQTFNFLRVPNSDKNSNPSSRCPSQQVSPR